MTRTTRRWAEGLAGLTTRHPGRVLVTVAGLTAAAVLLAHGLAMRMNWTDLLPSHHPDVRLYREVQERFGDPSIVIVLSGTRDAMITTAGELTARLQGLDLLHNVQGHLPTDFLRQHGFALLRPNDFDRALRIYGDPSLIGILSGLNNDYEREYADDAQNLRRDEIEVARTLLGLHRSLELLAVNLDPSSRTPGRASVSSGQTPPPVIAEAVDALLLGEPWLLSLDRQMLLIFCTPTAPLTDLEGTLTAVEEVQQLIAEIAPRHPEVSIELTGMGKICQDEVETINVQTQLLSLAALILIYLLLARSFRGWIIPLLALIPLGIGICWTLGLLRLIFGWLNIFTAMMGLVLLGLGIDFSIHLISRFYEERREGASIRQAAAAMLGETGTAVLTGGLTTAAAFLTLMIADTAGVFQFGVAAGAGVVLTLIGIFLTLPALLTLRERRRGEGQARSPVSPAGWGALGRVAATCWRRHIVLLVLFVLLAGASYWAVSHTAFEYDFLELEPKGLTSVRLEREIPERFGTSDQLGWVITESIEQSRALKEELRQKPAIAEIEAISDFIPPPGRLAAYAPRLAAFRTRLLADRDAPAAEARGPQSAGANALAAEFDRLWDNLDLMSNLAFQIGLDRIVRSIDGVTGYDSRTDSIDSTAVLPHLTHLLARGSDPDALQRTATEWETHMRTALLAMANADSVTLTDVPAMVRRAHLPRDGEGGFLLRITPRKYIFAKESLDRFAQQTAEVDAAITGTPQLFLVMILETLRDGRDGAILALIVIMVLLLIHFRGPLGLLAAIPLVGGMLFMLGAMHLLGMKYNYVNLIAVPIILGIGIDDGVHALHRFRAERGRGDMRLFASYRTVGRAILLTSLTTMIGFGSIAFYEYQGMASFGIVLFMGVGFCFLTTVFILPAVLRVVARWIAPLALAALLTGLSAALCPAASQPSPASAQTTATAPVPDSPAAATAAADSGRIWLARIDAAERVPHSYAEISQTITTSGGSERTLQARIWTADGGDVSLTAYTQPARVRGDKILIRDGGDNIWYYMHRRDVTRHFAGHTRRQKAMGSDFAYEDLATGDLIEDYTAEFLGFEKLNGELCVKLECTPTESGPSYDHLTLWAATSDHLSRQIDYYDAEGLLKTLHLSDFRIIEDRPSALRLEMLNHREGSRTVIVNEVVTYRAKPDPNLFTKAALPRELW